MGRTEHLAGCIILVVENEPVIALELRQLFEAEGAEVHIGPTPTDALFLIHKTSFSAAVLDFGLINDDTAPLCRTLRTCSVPFMYYTGFDDLDEKALGAPVVTKPASLKP